MDNYENEELRQEEMPLEPAAQEPEYPIYESQPASEPEVENAPVFDEWDLDQPAAEQTPPQQTYHGTGAGRKESPFANSPYEMNHRPQTQGSYSYEHTYVPPVPPEKPKKVKKQRTSGKGVWKKVLCAVLALVIVAGSCGITAMLVNKNWEARTSAMEKNFEKRMNDLEAKIQEESASQLPEVIYQDTNQTMMHPGTVYEKNMKTVVLVSAQVRATNIFGQSSTGVSTGSGFVLTEDGYVVTNHHVVNGATGVTVTMYDGSEYKTEVIGSDATNDVALLKINEDVTLQAVEIGSSDDLRVGDQVIVIGNALGKLTSSLTVGYVSGKERNISTDGSTINMIQTDAAINSGNSGGPLFNAAGQVVGITTAKYSGSSSSGASIEGIGFAIPINDAMPLVSDLMNYGYITSAYLGVMVNDVDEDSATYYGLPVGAYVTEVIPGYCAEKAGLKAKDIITAIGTHEINNRNELTRILRKFNAGETTTITVYRGGQELKLPITLDAKPQQESTNTPAPGNGQMPQEGSYDDWYNYFEPFFGGKG